MTTILDGKRFAEWLANHDATARVIAEHVGAVVASAALIVLWIALGTALRQFVERRDRAESEPDAAALLVLDAALGAGALGTLLLAPGMLGGLWPATVLGVSVVIALLVRRQAREAVRRLAEQWRGLPRLVRVAAPVALGLMLAPALVPPAEWDTLMYHLRLPLGALEHGRLVTPPDAVAFSALIGVAHLATLPLLALGLLEGTAVVQVLLLPLLMLGTSALARFIHAGASTSVAAAALLGCPALTLVAWSGRIDAVFVLAILAAHLAVLRALRSEREGALLASAVAIGIAIGTKTIAAAYLVALLPLLAVGRPPRVPALLRGALVVVITALPWALKSQLVSGTPLYPIGFGATLDPWLAALASRGAVDGPFDLSALRALWLSRAPFNLWDAFWAPERLTIEGEGRHYAFSPIFLVLPAILMFRAQRARILPHLLVPLLFVALVVLPFSEINLRYLMAAYPALAALSGVAVGVLRERFPSIRTLVRTAAVLLALVPFASLLTARAPVFASEFGHAIGTRGAPQHWRASGSTGALAQVADVLAVRAGAQDTVLMLWEARALALRQPVLMDGFTATWPLLAQLPAADECLRGTGVRWVLVGRGSLSYYVSRGMPPELMRLAAFSAFRSRCLGAPVFENGAFMLFPMGRP